MTTLRATDLLHPSSLNGRCIVVVHPGALGDVLLAVPAIRSLGVRFPRHQTLFIARESMGQLLLECGLIDKTMSLEGQAGLGLFSGPDFVPQELQEWLNRCDLAVAWMEDQDGALISLFQGFGIVQFKIQSPFSPALAARHQSYRFLETLEEKAGTIYIENTVEVPPSLVQRGTAHLDRLGVPRGRPLALVHPGSGSFHKCLSPKKVAFVLQQLGQNGLFPVIIEGPADHDAVEHVLKSISWTPPILRNIALSTLAGILAQATLYFGHDSGVTHLAALLGVRTIAAFGPTDPHRWAPLGAHVTIVQGAPCICPAWQEMKICLEKPCLDVPPRAIVTALGASAGT